jgi:hypothetical protein
MLETSLMQADYTRRSWFPKLLCDRIQSVMIAQEVGIVATTSAGTATATLNALLSIEA